MYTSIYIYQPIHIAYIYNFFCFNSQNSASKYDIWTSMLKLWDGNSYFYSLICSLLHNKIFHFSSHKQWIENSFEIGHYPQNQGSRTRLTRPLVLGGLCGVKEVGNDEPSLAVTAVVVGSVLLVVVVASGG